MSQGHRGHPHGQYNINFKTNLSEVEKLHKRVDIIFNPTFDPSLNLITEVDEGWEKMPFISKKKKVGGKNLLDFLVLIGFFHHCHKILLHII